MQTQQHNETVKAPQSAADRVAAAQAALAKAKEAESNAEAALVEAERVVKHAEAALDAEKERLSEHSRSVSRAVLEKQALPTAQASMLEAIDDALYEAKVKARDAKRALDLVRQHSKEAAGLVGAARDRQAREELLEMLRAQRAQLLELAAHIHRDTWNWQEVDGFGIKRDDSKLTIAISLP